MGWLDRWFGGRRDDSAGPAGGRGGASCQVGDRVLALWSDTYFYPGRVEAVDGDHCDITFDDGDRARVHRDHVRRPDFAVGSQVFCRHPSAAAFLPARVRQQKGEKLQVRFDDGQEAWTTLSMVRVKFPGSPSGGEAAEATFTPVGPAPGMMGPPGGGPQTVLNVGEPVTDLNWRAGDRVLARWWDFFWYPGSILAIGTKGFHILYDDGDQRIVAESQFMPLTVEEGESLYIRPKNQPQRVYMPATVVRAQGESLDVEYEDGTTENNLRVSRARFWRCPVGVTSFAFDEGDRVLAGDVDGCTYPAEIVSVDGDKVVVQFLDGPERMLTPELIRRYDLKAGQRVECRWKGQQQYFPGKITQMEGDRIHVDYDDGDKEWTTVRLVRLAPRP